MKEIPKRPIYPSGLTVYDKDLSSGGYTLYCPLRGVPKAYLLDIKGNIVKTWNIDVLPFQVQLMPDGTLLALGYLLTGGSAKYGVSHALRRYSWSGELLWEYIDSKLHHDFHQLKNGNILLLRHKPIPQHKSRKVRGGKPGTDRGLRHLYRLIKRKQATASTPQAGGEVSFGKRMRWNAQAAINSLRMDGDEIIELTPDKKIVWDWVAHKHLDPKIDVVCPVCPRLEWTHSNSLNEMPDGNILISIRQTSTIAIIDKETKEIVWRWTGGMSHQHDASILPNGNILVFDNGMHLSPVPRSRVIEVNPGTNEIVWQYMSPRVTDFFAPVISGAQRLWNGNTLICSGTQGRLFEVTPEKEVVWEWINPDYVVDEHLGKNVGAMSTNWIFKAKRYPTNYNGIRFDGHRTTPVFGEYNSIID